MYSFTYYEDYNIIHYLLISLQQKCIIVKNGVLIDHYLMYFI